MAKTTKAGSSGSLNSAVCLALLLILLGAALPSAWAQSADPNPDVDIDDEQSSSEHVEESEEAYRRRMELEEANDQADIIIDRSSGSLKAPVGMDALPYESRKHLRDELRSVIIENGEWQPEDAQADYPYTPSAAAQKDPELRKQEEEAWGELLSEYHEREAAVLAGGGRSGQPGSGQQDSQGQQGMGSASGRPGSPPPEPPSASQAGSSAAGAGVSQSALEFLKGKQGSPGPGSGNPGQAGDPGQAAPSEQAAATGEMALASTSAATASAGQKQSPGEASPEQLALNNQGQEQQAQQEQAQNAKEAMEKQKQESSSDSTPPPPPPPGSIAIGELAALNEGATRLQEQEELAEVASSQANDQSGSESGAEGNSDNETGNQPPPLPGTIAIPELEKLKGMENEDTGTP